ncbi:MAG: hypothetical protein KDC49_07180 [Saprospiraceae bacterium]|nr:hypothetical protein [Saprospiraceae bacterium]
MKILGISAFYHDSAAALLADGQLVAAFQEERFSRIKNDNAFPKLAIDACLSTVGWTIEDIDCVVFYEKPFWKLERIIQTVIRNVPFGIAQFLKIVPLWAGKRLWLDQEIKTKLLYKGAIFYSGHHLSHIALAFHSSPFDKAAYLCLDGVGELATSSIGLCFENKIHCLHEQHFPDSLGLLYSAFAQYCGFKVNSGEYKLMGLAPYGKPIYKQLIYNTFLKANEDGSFQLDMRYFHFTRGESMINQRFEKAMGSKAAKEGDVNQPFYADVAASIQLVLEEMVLKMLRFLKSKVSSDNLICSGGVFLNCKLNQRIVESGIFQAYHFPQNPGDAGAAAGAAMAYDLALNQETYRPQLQLPLAFPLKSVDAGRTIEKYGIDAQKPKDLPNIIAGLLARKMVIAWYDDHIEFGPRALGHTSILADPRDGQMKEVLNQKIKRREAFRPFAPIVRKEVAHHYFELGNANYDTMMVTASAKSTTKELMPAAVHEDGTARIQLISETSNPMLHSVLACFESLTKCPGLINTSLNVRGEPLAASYENALHCFLYTDIDFLVLNGQWLIDSSIKKDRLFRLIPQKIFEND